MHVLHNLLERATKTGWSLRRQCLLRQTRQCLLRQTMHLGCSWRLLPDELDCLLGIASGGGADMLEHGVIA